MIAGYFNQAHGCVAVAEPYSAIAWLKDGKVIGQAMFTGYTGSNIDIHLNAPRCVCRKTIKDVYSYVFKQLKCNRLTAKIEPTNDKLSRLLPRMGFEYKFTDEGYYGEPDKPIDALVFVLSKQNALKWIK
jgi:hypothetical protein